MADTKEDTEYYTTKLTFVRYPNYWRNEIDMPSETIHMISATELRNYHATTPASRPHLETLFPKVFPPVPSCPPHGTVVQQHMGTKVRKGFLVSKGIAFTQIKAYYGFGNEYTLSIITDDGQTVTLLTWAEAMSVGWHVA